MDNVFSENMGLMQDQHASYNIRQLCNNAKASALEHLNTTISQNSTTALATFQAKAKDITDNIRDTLITDTTIADIRDGIISDIAQTKQQVKLEIIGLTEYMHKDKNRILHTFGQIKTEVSTLLADATFKMNDTRDVD